MKFEAFKLDYGDKIVPVKDILDCIKNIPLNNRFKDHIRLEKINHHNGYSLGTFTKERHNSPALGHNNNNTTDIPLNNDEWIAEETTVLLCHSRNIMIVQYNHVGPRASAIGAYLSKIGIDNNITQNHITTIPIIDNDMANQILDNVTINKVSVRVAGNEQTLRLLSDSEAIGGTSGIPEGIQDIEIIIRAPQRQTLSKPIPFISNLLSKKDDVNKLKITGKSNRDDRSQEIDLLKGKLKHEKNIQRNTTTKRFNLQDIYDGLQESYNLFIEQDLI